MSTSNDPNADHLSSSSLPNDVDSSITVSTTRQFANKKVSVLGVFFMGEFDIVTYNNLVNLHNKLRSSALKGEISTDYPCQSFVSACENIAEALDLINRLSEDCKKLQNNIDNYKKNETSLKNSKYRLEEDVSRLKKNIASLNSQLDSSTKKNNSLSHDISKYNEKFRNDLLIKENQINHIKRDYSRIIKENDDLQNKISSLEENRSKLLSEIALFKQDSTIHYDATSDRPKHHNLIGEYKSLKEQSFDPLINSIFIEISDADPNLKVERKRVINELKSSLSNNIFLKGEGLFMQAINNDEVNSEYDSNVIESVLEIFYQQYETEDPKLRRKILPLIKNIVSIAKVINDYPCPGEWTKEDFNHATDTLIASFCDDLNLNSYHCNFSTELHKKISAVTLEALSFLEKAKLADPPAVFHSDQKNEFFSSEYHEAAKGYDEEGMVSKIIYPAYFVNGEVKVKSIVLTAALNRQELSNSIEVLGESLLKSIKAKWPDYDQESMSTLEKKILQINRLDIIKNFLESEIHRIDNFQDFCQKIIDTSV